METNEFSDRSQRLQIEAFIDRLEKLQWIKKMYDSEDIIQIICDIYQQPKNMVLSNSRKRMYLEPRQMIHFVLKMKNNISLTKIGEIGGHRDHTSVLHSIHTVKRLYFADKQYRKKVNEILKEFGISNEIMKEV